MKKTTTHTAELDESLLGASAESALAALAQAGPAAQTLIDQWLTRGNSAAIVEVAEKGSGSARKLARRAVNVLKARGIALPHRSRVATLAGGKSSPRLEAWMVPPDAVGNLLLVVASRTRESRFRAALAFLNDTLGVQRVDTVELSQSGLKEALTRILPDPALKPVRVSVDWARYRFEQARQRHLARRAPLPLGFDSATPLFGPAPEEQPAHPFDDEGLELADEDAVELGKASVALHSLPEFRAWLPPKEAVDQMMLEVGEGLTPGEQPGEDVLKRQLDRAIAAATDRFFTPERRADLVRAMKDCALSVLGREGEQRALDLVAAMKSIERAGLITDPPHEIGFLRGFFEKALSVMIAQGGGNLRIPVRMPAGETPGATAAPGGEASAPAGEAAAPNPDGGTPAGTE